MSEWSLLRNLQITNAGEDVEKREHFYTDSVNVRWCSPCGKQYGSSSEKNYPYDPTPGYISRQNYNSKRYIHPCVHSSTIHDGQDPETALNVYY